ncbi:hypothetical protein FDUTEX481_04924 [Tolypothrix sp. PCC 7601]|nr:hypothetical protein FDUTEX481_04924 [Tolypothrix sp. PCC 7601]
MPYCFNKQNICIMMVGFDLIFKMRSLKFFRFNIRELLVRDRRD